MRRILILVAALALLTTACKIQVNAEFTINADKTGAVVLEFGYDDEIKELAESSGESPDSMFGDMGLEDAPNAEVTTERRGDMTFQIVTVPIDDVTAAEGLGGEMGAGLTDDFTITFTDDLVTVTGSTTLDDALGGDSEDMAGIPPEMLSEFFEVNIRITMPGEILDHNATSRDGNTLTWNVNLTDPSISISAQSNPNASAGGGNTMVYIIIAAAVVLLGLLLWLFMKKRGAASGTTAPPMTMDDSAAPPMTIDDSLPPAPPPSE
ncbi:MAG: hypothetical protein MUP76_08380 [Acidimicrobiia bacterium]|nr:hypothetical protein [Acidimicrobiia bacterium]